LQVLYDLLKFVLRLLSSSARDGHVIKCGDEVVRKCYFQVAGWLANISNNIGLRPMCLTLCMPNTKIELPDATACQPISLTPRMRTYFHDAMLPPYMSSTSTLASAPSSTSHIISPTSNISPYYLPMQLTHVSLSPVPNLCSPLRFSPNSLLFPLSICMTCLYYTYSPYDSYLFPLILDVLVYFPSIFNIVYYMYSLSNSQLFPLPIPSFSAVFSLILDTPFYFPFLFNFIF